MQYKSTLDRVLGQKAESPRKTDELWTMPLVHSICQYKFLVLAKVQWPYKMLTLRRRNWAKETFNFLFLKIVLFISEYWEEGRGHGAQVEV